VQGGAPAFVGVPMRAITIDRKRLSHREIQADFQRASVFVA
jgi:hypothetical protein